MLTLSLHHRLGSLPRMGALSFNPSTPPRISLVQVLSPGCFPVDDTFTVYHPHDRTAEKSALPH